MRHINDAGLSLIKSSEGLQLMPYRCPAGYLTVGYGHVGSDVKEGCEITPGEADRLLAKDVARFEMGVDAVLGAAPTNDNQFSALVSFSFNLGLANLAASTLLKKHKKGDYAGAAAQFPLWNKARVNGALRVLPGLTKRRAAELDLYQS